MKVTLVIVKGNEIQNTTVSKYRIESFIQTYRQLGYNCYIL